MRTIHTCLSVTGLLRQGKPQIKKWCGCITVNGKTLNTVEELTDFLIKQLAEGHEVLPMGDCDNFDWKTGCRGHEHDTPATPINPNGEVKENE